jgi:hypothetical protein
MDQWFTLEINIARQTATLDYLIAYNEPGEYILQVYFPFTIQSVATNRIPPGPGSWSFLNVHPYGSIVRVTYQAKSGESQGFDSSIVLNLNQSLVQANHGTYTFLLPANRPIPIPAAEKADSVQPHVGVVSNAGARHNIYRVVLPPDSIVAQTLPEGQSFEISSDNSLVLRWDLGSSLPPLTVTYSIPEELRTYADLSFRSGLAIGIGIPVVISGLVELCKWGDNNKPNKPRKLSR